MRRKIMSTNIFALIKTILVTGAICGLLFYFGEKYLRNRAIETCITSGYEDYKNADSESSSRIPSWRTYNICMKEKGYETTVNSK